MVNAAVTTLGLMLVAFTAVVWGAAQGPLADALPYAGALGILTVVVAGFKFMRDFQDRVANATAQQLVEARQEIATMRADHRRDIDSAQADGRQKDQLIRLLEDEVHSLRSEVTDLRRQLGIPERRYPPPPRPTEGSDHHHD